MAKRSTSRPPAGEGLVSKSDFSLADLQRYVDVCIVQGDDPDTIEEKVETKFGVTNLKLNPVGKVIQPSGEDLGAYGDERDIEVS